MLNYTNQERTLRSHDDIVQVLVDRCLEGRYLTQQGLYAFCFERDGILFLADPARRDYAQVRPEDVKYVATLAEAYVPIGDKIYLEVGARVSENAYRELAPKVEAEARHILNQRAQDAKHKLRTS